MDSLEERVCVFFDEHYSDEFNPCVDYDQSDDDDNDDDSVDPEERALYWESQLSLLQEILERYNSNGSKLRKEITRSIDIARESKFCDCPKAKMDGCNHCMRQHVVTMLRDKGINATLCTSKWGDTKKFLRGSHEYIEVIGSTLNRKKQIPFVVEVEFRDQFEIAKPCTEYRKLLSELPEYYIGKPDYLNAVVKIVCESAKTSMKEMRIHMGPWRKTSFMLMKWSANNNNNNNNNYIANDNADQTSTNKLTTLTETSDELHRPLSPAGPARYSQFSAAPPAVVVT